MADELMFTREHFPIELYETTSIHGKKFWDFDRIEIPPYHPSMRENGIDFESVPDLLYNVVEETVRDLEEIAVKREDVRVFLQRIAKDPNGRIVSESKIARRDSKGIKFESVPVAHTIYVGINCINPYEYGGDQGIRIDPELSPQNFKVPEEVRFTPELMSEYEMKEDFAVFGKKYIQCPHNWYRHNLANMNAIFYRNLVIALDNEVVKKIT